MNDTIALRKLQLEAFSILIDFSSFCREHGLTWFLLSGSALGAKRHDGFIPWDDDLDVGMLRQDYERFLSLVDLYPSEYRVDVPGINPKLATMFTKVCRRGTHFATKETVQAGYDQGIFIDIIPLDRVAMEPDVRKWQLRNSRFWQSMSYLWHSGDINVPGTGVLGSIERFGCRAIHHLVRVFVSRRTILNRYSRSILSNRDGLSDEWMLLSWPHTKPFPTDVLVPVSTHLFEGVQMPVPGKLEDYLELMYGDWEVLPSEDKRHTHMPLKIVFSDGEVWTQD